MLPSVSAQNLPTSACCAYGTALATHPVDRNVATGHPVGAMRPKIHPMPAAPTQP